MKSHKIQKTNSLLPEWWYKLVFCHYFYHFYDNNRNKKIYNNILNKNHLKEVLSYPSLENFQVVNLPIFGKNGISTTNSKYFFLKNGKRLYIINIEQLYFLTDQVKKLVNFNFEQQNYLMN